VFKESQQENWIILDSQLDFIQNIQETLKISKSSITAYNNETVNRLYLSRIKILKSVLGQGNDNNNLDKLKKLILSTIKEEKEKDDLSHRTIKIIEEIDNLEFCLNPLVQDINKYINKLTLINSFIPILQVICV
jgi:hypothetical protein